MKYDIREKDLKLNFIIQTAFLIKKEESVCTIGRITKFYPGDLHDKIGKPAISTWTDPRTILYIKSETYSSEKCLEHLRRTHGWSL